MLQYHQGLTVIALSGLKCAASHLQFLKAVSSLISLQHHRQPCVDSCDLCAGQDKGLLAGCIVERGFESFGFFRLFQLGKTLHFRNPIAIMNNLSTSSGIEAAVRCAAARSVTLYWKQAFVLGGGVVNEL
jgi:hypothetical protein